MDAFVEDFLQNNCPDLSELDEKKRKDISEKLRTNLNIELDFSRFSQLENLQPEDLKNEIKKLTDRNINLKKTKYSNEIFAFAQKSLLLQILDKSWKDHLLSLDHLRQGISLRAYGQKDPLNEYKRESFELFEDMLDKLRKTITSILSNIQIEMEKVSEQENSRVSKNLDSSKKIQRNAICPLCDSGKKYKHCCGRL